jgi:hypothetical protein
MARLKPWPFEGRMGLPDKSRSKLRECGYGGVQLWLRRYGEFYSGVPQMWVRCSLEGGISVSYGISFEETHR